VKRLFVALLLAGLWACTNEEDASRTLRVSGYKNVKFTGYEWWACSKGDSTCTGFTAIAPNGEKVSGAVGCSVGGCTKGCTIRL
jgi:hypothetical protein